MDVKTAHAKSVGGIHLAWVLSLLTATAALGFHDQGVATCQGCHVMHAGVEGELVAGELLLDSATDLCLSCHADDEGSVLGDDPLAPPPELGAGNFVFLIEDNLNDAEDGTLLPILGDAAGHNVVAPGYGLRMDSRNSVAPGGSFPAAQLGCTSCHDPHGRETFRMLWGVGPVQGGLAHFSFAAPRAEGIALNGLPESPTNHTAYRGGVSDWCRNCHGQFHDEVGDPLEFEHPSDEILPIEIVDQYNAYDGDPDPVSPVVAIGTFETAYLPEAPFEAPGARVDSQSGATPLAKVMCVTCHRAHATSAPHSGRWDFNVALLAQDGEISGSYPIPNPYGPNQGTLCTKCHAGGPPTEEEASALFD